MKVESSAQFAKKKPASGFGNDMTNFTNVNQSHWKSQNWDFDVILLSKVENLRA